MAKCSVNPRVSDFRPPCTATKRVQGMARELLGAERRGVCVQVGRSLPSDDAIVMRSTPLLWEILFTISLP